jgi:hypothetical protein
MQKKKIKMEAFSPKGCLGRQRDFFLSSSLDWALSWCAGAQLNPGGSELLLRKGFEGFDHKQCNYIVL